MATRVTKNIALPDKAWQDFQKWCTDSGRIQSEMVGRVLTWFLTQPEPIQRSIVDRIEAEMKAAYANTLRKIADDLEGAKPTGKGATSRGNDIEVHAR
jgi:hypothetical protein